jgi:hypothetical protein
VDPAAAVATSGGGELVGGSAVLFLGEEMHPDRELVALDGFDDPVEPTRQRLQHREQRRQDGLELAKG